jgi:hypothetical protein
VIDEHDGRALIDQVFNAGSIHFLEEHRDDITALQVLYSRPYRERLTFAQVKELVG